MTRFRDLSYLLLVVGGGKSAHMFTNLITSWVPVRFDLSHHRGSLSERLRWRTLEKGWKILRCSHRFSQKLQKRFIQKLKKVLDSLSWNCQVRRLGRRSDVRNCPIVCCFAILDAAYTIPICESVHLPDTRRHRLLFISFYDPGRLGNCKLCPIYWAGSDGHSTLWQLGMRFANVGVVAWTLGGASRGPVKYFAPCLPCDRQTDWCTF